MSQHEDNPNLKPKKNHQTNSRKLRRKRLIEVKKTGTKEEIRIVRELCYETGKAVQKHHEYLTNKNK